MIDSVVNGPDQITVLAVSGSLRAGSYNRQLLEAAKQLAPDSINVVVYDTIADIPPFDADLEAGPAPGGVTRFRSALRAADAVLIATPEYNGSVPGQLKNALDWVSRSDTPGVSDLIGSAMYARPVAVVSASTGQYGGVWSALELRKILARQGAAVVDEVEVAVPRAVDAFGGDGLPVRRGQHERLVNILSVLAREAQDRRQGGNEPAEAQASVVI